MQVTVDLSGLETLAAEGERLSGKAFRQAIRNIVYKVSEDAWDRLAVRFEQDIEGELVGYTKVTQRTKSSVIANQPKRDGSSYSSTMVL